ncbi:S49 family peptidase [Methylobacterium planeticum]|uniref:S49 family peptidase n=1 Tax=Methylobacterium planeticum TaxID=2615211 RepID=A0A6N6MKQ8_9HYPH|nr:S49 family peptidase [Methylobacterium planeticum]KAB1068835.1 S49 family peptidase [Methylobacterium planeticum]
MSAYLPRIAEALSRPLLFHPTKLEVILASLDGRLGPALEVDRPGPDASRFMGRAEAGRPYRTEGGVAFVPIVGSLANRGAYIGASSGIVSYEGISAQIRAAAEDLTVHSIVLDIDSPGGEATGMFRLAAQIRQTRASKRIVAFVDDLAASAAYGIASQAHEIVVSPTSIVGSIGVVLTHVDRSAEMEKAGRKVTLIHAGANKVDGHPFGPLSESVKADLQAEVGAFYDQFLATVAAGRPGLSIEKARATEARTFIGKAAIDRGLADRIGSLESVVADLRSRAASRARPQPGSLPTMTNPIPAPATAAPKLVVSSAPLSATERHAENVRTQQILSDPRVFGFEALAMELANAAPELSADAIARMTAKAAGRPSASRTAGLTAAINRLVRARGGAPIRTAEPSSGSNPKSGLALAVAEMVAKDQARRGIPVEEAERPRSGLAAAVAEMIRRDAR